MQYYHETARAWDLKLFRADRFPRSPNVQLQGSSRGTTGVAGDTMAHSKQQVLRRSCVDLIVKERRCCGRLVSILIYKQGC